MRMHIATAGICLLAQPGLLRGQGMNDEAAVTRAAASHYKGLNKDRRFGIDPRVLIRHGHPAHSSGGKWAGERSEAEMQRLLPATEATPYRYDGPDPSCTPANLQACWLKGVDAYMALARPAIEGDSATVFIYVVQNVAPLTRKYSALSMLTAEATLARSREGWAVVALKILGQS